ncbi:MAG: DHH family phosphoesterase, partial [Flavobacteriaceae bacterium]
MDQAFINTLEQTLQNPQKILIIPHKNPDGDALGSALALMHFLRNEQHQAIVVSPNDYPLFLKWLPGE